MSLQDKLRLINQLTAKKFNEVTFLNALEEVKNQNIEPPSVGDISLDSQKVMNIIELKTLEREVEIAEINAGSIQELD